MKCVQSYLFKNFRIFMVRDTSMSYLSREYVTIIPMFYQVGEIFCQSQKTK